MDERRMARADDFAEEQLAPVPGDRYKDVRYRGGRDPVTGIAPSPNGNMSNGDSVERPLARAPYADPVGEGIGSVGSPPHAAAAIIVEKGDTLSKIAGRHQVTVVALMKANGLANEKIAPGQRLILPQ